MLTVNGTLTVNMDHVKKITTFTETLKKNSYLSFDENMITFKQRNAEQVMQTINNAWITGAALVEIFATLSDDDHATTIMIKYYNEEKNYKTIWIKITDNKIVNTDIQNI